MDGTILNSNDEFPETDEVFLEYSNASGKRKKRPKTRRDQRRAKRDQRQTARADRKERKLRIKEGQAETQKKVAESLTQQSPDEAMLLATITKDKGEKQTEDKPTMSQGLKIGLIVGGVVVVGVITILVIRRMRKNKGK